LNFIDLLSNKNSTRFCSSDPTNNLSDEEEKSSHSHRIRSVSTTFPINNQIKSKINLSRRRKSTSLTIDSNDIKSNNSEINSTINSEKVIPIFIFYKKYFLF
jgi:hypothetical protein